MTNEKLLQVAEKLAEDMSLIEGDLEHLAESVRKMAAKQNTISEKLSKLVIEYGEYAEEQSLALSLLGNSIQQILEKLRAPK